MIISIYENNIQLSVFICYHFRLICSLAYVFVWQKQTTMCINPPMAEKNVLTHLVRRRNKKKEREREKKEINCESDMDKHKFSVEINNLFSLISICLFIIRAR